MGLRLLCMLLSWCHGLHRNLLHLRTNPLIIQCLRVRRIHLVRLLQRLPDCLCMTRLASLGIVLGLILHLFKGMPVNLRGLLLKGRTQ